MPPGDEGVRLGLHWYFPQFHGIGSARKLPPMQTRYPVATKVFVGRAASDSGVMASAGITIEDDGSIRALTRLGLDNAGSAAAIAAVLSEELSMSVDRIRVEAADTATHTADGVPVSATVELRSTAVAVRAYLLKQASTYFAMDASELVLNDGRVITFDGRAMTYQDLTHAQEHDASQARTDVNQRMPYSSASQRQLGRAMLDKHHGERSASSGMREGYAMAAEAEGERAACQRRTPTVDSPASWDPYEVWLTRVRSPHQSMKAGAAVTVAPRPSITTQLQTAEIPNRTAVTHACI